MNEYVIFSVLLCVDFKYVVYIVNDVEERKLILIVNILGYV